MKPKRDAKRKKKHTAKSEKQQHVIERNLQCSDKRHTFIDKNTTEEVRN